MKTGLVLRLPRFGFVGPGEDVVTERPWRLHPRGPGALLRPSSSCHPGVPPPASRTPAASSTHASMGKGDLPAADRGAPPGASQREGFSTQASGSGGCRWSRGVSTGHPAGTFLSSGHTASPKCPRDTEQWALEHCPTMSMEALSNCSISSPAVSGDGEELGGGGGAPAVSKSCWASCYTHLHTHPCTRLIPAGVVCVYVCVRALLLPLVNVPAGRGPGLT